MKKIIFILLFISTLFTLNAQQLKQKYVRGNISDKISAIKQAGGDEWKWLSKNAIKFALENHNLLGNDSELEDLVVTAVHSYSEIAVSDFTEIEKKDFVSNLVLLLTDFEDSNKVQIAIISKIIALREIIPTVDFTDLVNKQLSSKYLLTSDPNLIRNSITALQYIGNNESFIILYNFSNNSKFNAYSKEIEQGLIKLVPVSVDEIIEIIRIGNFNQIKKVFNICQKNSQISSNLLCEIAENVLNESILLVNNSSVNIEDLVALQLSSLKILCDQKFTRSAPTVLNFFATAKQEYNANLLSQEQFEDVIYYLSMVAPLSAVVPLTNYLEELNSQKEKGYDISNSIVLSIIKNLGAIGDKSAFDSLLEVTYLNYPDTVLSAARDALAGLRW